MKNIWAPWRFEYISNSLKEEGCIFCNRLHDDIKNDEKNLILYRALKSFVIMNKFPYNNGHLMIVPSSHKALISDLESDELSEMMFLLQQSEKIIRKTMQPDGFNIGVNMGKTAGAGIADHIHIHIVPRWDGDTNFMPVIGDIKVISESLESTYSKLFKEFSNI